MGDPLSGGCYQDLRGEKYNLTIAVFIATYARMVMGGVASSVIELKGKQFYMDTDSIVTDVKLPDSMVGSELGQLKYEVRSISLYSWVESNIICTIQVRGR